MGNRIDAMNTAVNIRDSYLAQNPKATKEQVMAQVRSQLQEMKKNGAKISDKQITNASVRVSDIANVTAEQVAANLNSNITKSAKQSVEKLNNAWAKKQYSSRLASDHYYDEFNGLSKETRQKRHKQNMADAKAAFSDEKFAVVETPSNNQNKKVANAEYMSSKKKKQAKKEVEIKSQNEHKLQRPIKDKKVLKAKRNNIHYCTSQGIMTDDARKVYENIKGKLNGALPVIDKKTPNSTLNRMAEYYRELEAQAKKAVSDVVKTATEAVDKNPPKPPKGKGKIGWIVAGCAAALGTVGAFALKKSEKPKEEQQEQLKLAS